MVQAFTAAAAAGRAVLVVGILCRHRAPAQARRHTARLQRQQPALSLLLLLLLREARTGQAAALEPRQRQPQQLHQPLREARREPKAALAHPHPRQCPSPSQLPRTARGRLHEACWRLHLHLRAPDHRRPLRRQQQLLLAALLLLRARAATELLAHRHLLLRQRLLLSRQRQRGVARLHLRFRRRRVHHPARLLQPLATRGSRRRRRSRSLAGGTCRWTTSSCCTSSARAPSARSSSPASAARRRWRPSTATRCPPSAAVAPLLRPLPAAVVPQVQAPHHRRHRRPRIRRTASTR